MKRLLTGDTGSYEQDLAGMVVMGEYTNGCICKAKGRRISP